MRRLTWGLLATVAACGGTTTQQPSTSEALVRSYADSKHIPGIGVAVMEKGSESEAVFYGKANLEQDVPVTRDSVFRIASVTKTFTAVGIMLLKDQGKLDTADKLSKYVEFPRGDELTLKMLLQHTSGVPDFSEVPAFDEAQAKAWTPQEIVALLKDRPYQFEPGTSAKYTNTNFLLLGLVIEKASGQSYADFVRQSLAAPLGMEVTAAGSDDAVIPHRVSGYLWEDGYTNAPFVSVVAPFATGNLVSRPVELVLLAKALRKGQGALLSDASIDEMTAPTYLKDGTLHADTRKAGYTTSFGYGLELRKPDGQDQWIATKGGAIAGFKSMFMYFRGSDTAVAGVGNGNEDLFELCKQVADAHGAVP